ncbi:MAG: Zn-dependent hydrolase [Lachnospiraceae bacterium]|nr:Zn-dependent hydrolase [Lachnospiraceae bacterium]
MKKTGCQESDCDQKKELWDIIEQIGWIGKEADGSITRLPASSAYDQASEVVKMLMLREDMEVTTDAVGNVHGVRQGSEPSRGTIMFGSHLDTVRHGGLFDGTLGIAAAISCIRRLRREQIILPCNLEIVCFQGEEGSPLGGTFGSRAMMGLIDLRVPGYLDRLNDYGFTPEQIAESRIDTSSKKCFLELHIEQGKILETEQKDIGIVTGIVGITRYQIRVCGKANHAGTTPMNLRCDALVAAAGLVQSISETASQYTNGLVATVGQLQVFPNAVAVIPGQVELVLEIRHMDQHIVDDYAERIRQEIRLLEQNRTGIHVEMEQIVKKGSVVCDEGLQELYASCCEKLGYSYRRIASGAGHDGNAIGQKIPTAMIFVPSREGLSHCKEEWTDLDQAMKGADVLYEAVKMEAELG